MIQFTEAGLVTGRNAIAECREQFDRQRFTVLPQLLDPALLARIADALDRGGWETQAIEGIGVDEISRSAALTLLRFLANDPAFLAMVDDITGCGPFTWFNGRIYRMRPEADHYDSWHSDAENGSVAMSVNLAPRGYAGGIFQMRELRSEQLLVNFANTGMGDAIFFRTSRHLVHRVTPLEPGEAKVAFAGWFTGSESGLLGRLKETRAAAAPADSGR